MDPLHIASVIVVAIAIVVLANERRFPNAVELLLAAVWLLLL